MIRLMQTWWAQNVTLEQRHKRKKEKPNSVLESHQPQIQIHREKAAVASQCYQKPETEWQAHPPVSGITLNAHGWSLPVKRHRPLDWKVRPTRPFSRVPWPCLSPLERPFSTKKRQPYAASKRHILALRTSTGSKWGYRRCYYKQTAAERKWM